MRCSFIQKRERKTMLLKAKVLWWKVVHERSRKRNAENKAITDKIRYTSDEKFESIDSDVFTDAELDDLREVAERYKKGSYPARDVISKIDAVRALYVKPKGEKIRRLEAIVDAVRAFVGPLARRWVYLEEQDGMICPYLITSVKYTPQRVETTYGERIVYPPYTTMVVNATRRGQQMSRSFTWRKEDLLPLRTIAELFHNEGIFVETDEHAKVYDAQVERYSTIVTETGAQYASTGYGLIGSRSSWSYASNLIAMERDGYSTKVVIDDDETDETDETTSSRRHRSSSTSTESSYWDNYDARQAGKRVAEKSKDEEDEEMSFSADVVDEDEDAVESQKRALPLHPYVRIFDLSKHDFLTIHTENLIDYPWDASLIDKLILPAETKDLIHILVQGTRDNSEDIIKGKMQGVLVLATGDPGTGKTLTAEIFSETIKRPLYVIPCSELGTDSNSIESNLSTILRRAQRWKAILLIDEADVYIRTRGEDIDQNAIVGVFLRVLEYYRGVLFMTSNRATAIDDAILSRMTAWVRYALPDTKALAEIWSVLAEQYAVKLKASDISALVDAMPDMSGRCVRNLLKLSKLLAVSRKAKVDAEMLKHVAQFQHLPHLSDEQVAALTR
jgi:SpoVK/Ycf46/Vps4 family AAA+-type ATPase